MFGILKPQSQLLNLTQRRQHQSAYCNLCGFVGAKYGMKSRFLVVHDIATMWWLLRDARQNEFELRQANCIRGGTRSLKRRGLDKVQQFLAAVSVYVAGVKVQDDLADGDGRFARVAHRLYRGAFQKARGDLIAMSFPVVELEDLIRRHESIEDRGEIDLECVSSPTAEAYGLVAAALARNGCSTWDIEDAAEVGRSLGMAIYLVDAIRDYSQDRGVAFNPLCLIDGSETRALSPQLRERTLRVISDGLSKGRDVITRGGESLLQCWQAIEHRLFQSAGVRPESVTLYATCCVPCGDGAILFDGDDINACCCCSLGACCCSVYFMPNC